MRIALFGGSFNPPHLGHVGVAQGMIESNQFDELWILPCLTHAFQKALAPYPDRIAMCRLAFEPLSPKILVKKTEEEIKNTQGWSILTLRHLHQQNPQHEFYWLMGSDLIQEKEHWKNFDEIEKMVKIHPIPRASHEHSPFPNLSSTDIRGRISKCESLADLVPKEVEDYIQARGLYR